LRDVLLKSSVEKIEVAPSIPIGADITISKTPERRCKLNAIAAIFVVVSLSLQIWALLHTNLTIIKSTIAKQR